MAKKTQEEIQLLIKQQKEKFKEESIKYGFDPLLNNLPIQKISVPYVSIKETLEKKHIDKIIDDYMNGKSSHKLAAELNTHASYILELLKKHNIHVRNMSECHRIYPINETFFDIIDTQEKAYFLGFLYADGCNHQTSNAITIDIERDDEEILEKFAKLIYLENPEEKIKNYDRVNELTGKIYYSSVLNIHSKYMCGILDKHGCVQRKTKVLTFPQWLDKNLIRHFIRGYYDGDGSLHLDFRKGRSSSFKITSTFEFVTEIKKIIKIELNLHTCLKKATNSDVYDVSNSGSRLVEKVLDWFYIDSTIYLERKHHLYILLKDKIKHVDKLAAAGTQGYSKSLKDRYK